MFIYAYAVPYLHKEIVTDIFNKFHVKNREYGEEREIEAIKSYFNHNCFENLST